MRARTLFVAAVLAVTVVALAPPASASGTTYSFTLLGPNTAENHATGDTIRLTGSGNFDTGGAVSGGGAFTHFLADGTVFAKGTWRATGFTSFVSFGGENPGQQGGVLSITVTLVPIGGTSVSGVPMTITCELGTLPSPPPEEGTTVDGFTEPTGGFTLFHLL